MSHSSFRVSVAARRQRVRHEPTWALSGGRRALPPHKIEDWRGPARKLRGYRVPTRLCRADAEELPFEDETFDHVVSTLVLCTVRDPTRALAEVHRMLKPHGRLLFIEHVRSEDST